MQNASIQATGEAMPSRRNPMSKATARCATSPTVKLMMAEAQLYAAQIAMGQAHRDFDRGLITGVERGRILAKQTRLETKVLWARAELNGTIIYYPA